MSRAQLAAYAGLGVALLLLGVKALSINDAPAAGEAGIEIATEPVGSAGPGAGSGDFVVHVTGAVRRPGVYRLPAGSRVGQALERAGGARPGGDPEAINLAARLGDGQQVVVPRRHPAGGPGPAALEDGPISLGSASAADLEQIDGIGPITAEEIIAFRDQRGGLSSVEELDEMPGIGPATMESLSARLQP